MTKPAPLRRIIGFRRTSSDPEHLARFYEQAFGWRRLAAQSIPPSELTALGVLGAGRRIPLILGDQTLDLDGFSVPGRPYPQDATSADLVFQHLAIVVSDIEAAYRRVLDQGALPISHKPITLPKSAGGVTAFKFRDPEGHPLELLQRPPDPTSPSGPSTTHAAGLQINHSAISVADADASTAFYVSHGLHVGLRTLNQGWAQAALDDLPTPVVDVAPLEPSHGTAHLELLGYRTPRGRAGPSLRPNDIASTRLVWDCDRDGVLIDPDGHLHQLQRRS